MNEHLFCGNHGAIEKYLFYIKTFYPLICAESTENFYSMTQDEYPKMNLVVEKIDLQKEGYSDEEPINYFNQLPLIELENPIQTKESCFELERLSSSIARETRRGRGNTLLFNSINVPVWNPSHFNYIYYDKLNVGEFVLLYNGQSKFDSPILMGANNTKYVYVKHPDFEKYCRRFRFKTEEKE